MSETVARARMFGFHGDWVALERSQYEKHHEGDVVFYEVAEKLERERDEARRERDHAIKTLDSVWDSWSKALDEARGELARVRKELVASNRGAEKNAKVNQGICARLAEAERERDEARRELAEVLQRLSVWEGVASRMKKQLSFDGRVVMGPDWTAIGYREGMAAALHSGGIRGAKWHAERKGLQGEAADNYISGFNAALDEYK